jgi:hypothetical protein
MGERGGNNVLNTQSRYGKTQRKTVTLTKKGHGQIHAFAQSHQMTFSAAIETLALIGMKADLTTLLVPLLQDVVDKTLQRNFNRLAKLSLLAAAEAAMAHDLSTMLLLQVVRLEAVQHPQDFENRLGVSYAPDDMLDARIRAIYDEMRGLARQRQQRVLKRPLQDIITRLQDTSSDAVQGDVALASLGGHPGEVQDV